MPPLRARLVKLTVGALLAPPTKNNRCAPSPDTVGPKPAPTKAILEITVGNSPVRLVSPRIWIESSPLPATHELPPTMESVLAATIASLSVQITPSTTMVAAMPADGAASATTMEPVSRVSGGKRWMFMAIPCGNMQKDTPDPKAPDQADAAASIRSTY